MLEAVVTVVDCANFALDLFASDAAMAQIVHADIVILNKGDLVDDDVAASLERRIAVIKPRARQIRAVFGRAPTAAILSVPEEPAVASQHHRHNTHAHDHILADGFSAHAVSINEPISAVRFQEWLNEGFPHTVFRAKGIIRFDRLAGWFVFQLCGGRASFEPYAGSPLEGGMVFIGRDIDGPALECRLNLCLAPQQPQTDEYIDLNSSIFAGSPGIPFEPFSRAHKISRFAPLNHKFLDSGTHSRVDTALEDDNRKDSPFRGTRKGDRSKPRYDPAL